MSNHLHIGTWKLKTKKSGVNNQPIGGFNGVLKGGAVLELEGVDMEQ